MPSLSHEQQELLDILRATYQNIHLLEEELNLRISQQDTRIRVDYFYDAARALTNDELSIDYRRMRLSVEWLAFDAVAIRYIEYRPLAALKPNEMHYSASVELIETNPYLPNTSRKANRDDKSNLKREYLRFGVVFVALFKPFADRDHRDKVEELEEQLGVTAQVADEIEQFALGNTSIEEVQNLINMIDDPKLKAALKDLLDKQRYKQPQVMKEAMSVSKQSVKTIEQSIKELHKQHMQFLSSQLGLYEQGKAMVKELAGQGLNVAGPHLDQALSQHTDLGVGR